MADNGVEARPAPRQVSPTGRGSLFRMSGLDLAGGIRLAHTDSGRKPRTRVYLLVEGQWLEVLHLPAAWRGMRRVTPRLDFCLSCRCHAQVRSRVELSPEPITSRFFRCPNVRDLYNRGRTVRNAGARRGGQGIGRLRFRPRCGTGCGSGCGVRRRSGCGPRSSIPIWTTCPTVLVVARSTAWDDDRAQVAADNITWPDDPLRLYLNQIGKIALLSHQEEVTLARKVELSRRRFRRELLEVAFVIRSVVRTLERVHDKELPFDRTIQVSVSDQLEKHQILGRFPHNLRTLAVLLERNREDYRVMASKSASKAKRQCARLAAGPSSPPRGATGGRTRTADGTFRGDVPPFRPGGSSGWPTVPAAGTGEKPARPPTARNGVANCADCCA